MDFKEGGHWHYAMLGPEGEEHWALANYINIQNQKRFTGLDAFADADGNVNEAMPRSKWDVTFTSRGELTLVEFPSRTTTCNNWKQQYRWASKKDYQWQWKDWTNCCRH